MNPLQIFIRRVIAGIPGLVTQYGLHPEVAARYSLVKEYMLATGRKPPSIISGYRSTSKQRCLKENWLAGYRKNAACDMPISQPACRSWHMNTVAGVPASLAIDVYSRAPDLPYFGQLWKQMPYGKAGSSFGDPNHFHVELPFHRPPSIC